jgi:hypothetical protein
MVATDSRFTARVVCRPAAAFARRMRPTDAVTCASGILPDLTASRSVANAAPSSGECRTISLPAAIASTAASPGPCIFATPAMPIESV